MLFNVVFVVSLAYLPVFCRSLEMAVPPSVQSNATADRELLRKNGLCFLSAASDNHFDDLLAHIESVQFMYPCFPMYIANLGAASSLNTGLIFISHCYIGLLCCM